MVYTINICKNLLNLLNCMCQFFIIYALKMLCCLSLNFLPLVACVKAQKVLEKLLLLLH